MKKRFLTRVAVPFLTCLLLFGQTAQAVAYDAIAPDSFTSVEFQIPGSVRDYFINLLDVFGEGIEEGDVIDDVAMVKLLSGVRFFFGAGQNNDPSAQPEIYAGFPATADEFTLFLDQEKISTGIPADTEERSYGGKTYFVMGPPEWPQAAYMYDGGKIWSSDETGIKNIIDVANGSAPPLSSNASYADMKKTLPIGSAFLSVFVDARKIFSLIEKNIQPETGGFSVILETLKRIFVSFGLTASKIATGYEIRFAAKMTPEAVASSEFNFAPGGNFTPSLYKKFPNLPTIFYVESNNLKKQFSEGGKFNELLLKNMSQAGQTDIPVSSADFLSSLREETGVDFRPILNILDKKYAVALQDTNEIIPALTVMADVSSNPSAAEIFLSTWNDVIKLGIRESSNAVVQTSTLKIGSKTFSRYNIDLTKTEGYDGPPLPEISLTMGVTDDAVLLISTDPLIATHFGQGLHNNGEFTGAYLRPNQPVTEIEYIGLRQIWNFTDKFLYFTLDQGAKSGNAPSLSVFKNFYGFLPHVYYAKSLFLEGSQSNSTILSTITLSTDNVSHENFKEWKQRLKTQDLDKDGLSDFNEFFIHYTDFDSADTDGDGINDGQEVENHTDPLNVGAFLKDIAPDAWFAPEVSLLYRKQVIKGYPDGTYGASKNVTRAEFTCMVDRAFGVNLQKFTGIPTDEFSPIPTSYVFSDVRDTDWFSACVKKALRKNIVIPGEKFRPQDPINRAEAMAILVKTNIFLQTSLGQNMTDLPFKDVPKDAWFRSYVESAYINQLTRGRTTNEFAPMANVTRAEAAVMIKRALDFEFQNIENPPSNMPGTGLPFLPIFPILLKGAPI